MRVGLDALGAASIAAFHAGKQDAIGRFQIPYCPVMQATLLMASLERVAAEFDFAPVGGAKGHGADHRLSHDVMKAVVVSS